MWLGCGWESYQLPANHRIVHHIQDTLWIPLTIKHGWQENTTFMDEFPIATPIYFANFPSQQYLII